MLMNAINSAAKALNIAIDTSVVYIQKNAFAILVLLAVAYYIRTYVTKNGSLTSSGYMLAEDRNAAHNATSREEELRQVRLRQQEIASERAKQAAIERKIKDNKERERKNNVAKKKHMQGGNKLGGGKNTTAAATGDACAYTPLQPSSAQSRGYRPARRTVRRG